MPVNPKRIASIEEQPSRLALLGGTEQIPATILPKTSATNPNPLSFITYRVKQPTPGTPVQGPNMKIPNGYDVVVRAFHTNLGIIYIGNSQANAVKSNQNTFPLYADQDIKLSLQNANAIWFDADNAGEGIAIISEQ